MTATVTLVTLLALGGGTTLGRQSADSVWNDGVESHPGEPVMAYRAIETCSSEPLTIYPDVVYDPHAGGPGTCAPYGLDPPAPDVRFMAIQGAEASSVIRYPVGSQPTTRQYEVLEDGAVKSCVEVKMPGDGAFRSMGSGGAENLVLLCIGPTPCHEADGSCCCPSCNCIICYCAAGASTCNPEDGFVIDGIVRHLNVYEKKRIP